ncbi:9259_t:CDS:1 [Diversispora eburnea]|uniref:9259_t:CDS:1 n=1 Tax=Diversispora eburnea TaxID=1213867 RepID=A0A9N8ZI38_9GLOM|nr:9259_t:CDS:1 [Diversispora eburnea]
MTSNNIREALSLIREAQRLLDVGNYLPSKTAGAFRSIIPIGSLYDVSLLHSFIDKYKHDATGAQTKLSNAERQISNCFQALDREISNKGGQITSLNGQITFLNSQITSLIDQLTTSQYQNSRKSTEINELNVQLEEKQEQIVAVQNELKDFKGLVTDLRNENGDKDNEIHGKEKRIKRLKEDNENLSKDLSQFQRSIIIIGYTGSGKSTLANLITGTNNFKESEYCVSETKEGKLEKFTAENGIKYHIIDIIGINDTELSTQETLKKLKEATRQSSYNLYQVLFVFGGRFTKAETKVFNLIREKLFKYNEDITKYITLVRTRFIHFQNESKCKNDIDRLKSQIGKEIVESCGEGKIIHLDNPPINVSGDDSEIVETQINLNKKIRELSRKKILDHLLFHCQESFQDHESYNYLGNSLEIK